MSQPTTTSSIRQLYREHFGLFSSQQMREVTGHLFYHLLEARQELSLSALNGCHLLLLVCDFAEEVEATEKE